MNRLLGALVGLSIGDALGAPHEFRGGINLENYTGLLQFPIKRNNRFQGNKTSVVGQVTDDTTMTIALVRALINYRSNTKSFSLSSLEEVIIEEYLNWANDRMNFMEKILGLYLKE